MVIFSSAFHYDALVLPMPGGVESDVWLIVVEEQRRDVQETRYVAFVPCDANRSLRIPIGAVHSKLGGAPLAKVCKDASVEQLTPRQSFFGTRGRAKGLIFGKAL